MNKKGFTLIELLAVIVVLAVIMSIASTQVLKQKKAANIEEAKQIEKSIKDLGPDIYMKYKAFFSTYNTKYKVSVSALKDYLKNTECDSNDTCKIKNPSGGEACAAYLLVDTGDNGDMFKGYIDCGDLYKTKININNYSEVSSF